MAKRNHKSHASSTALRLIPIAIGLLGMICMLVFGAMAGRFLTWHLMLGGLSFASILGGLFWMRDAKWKETLSAFVYTFFFAMALVMIYLISANRHVRFDVTRDKLHTLTPQTQSLLRVLPPGETFTVQAFAPLAEHQALQRFLNNYTRTNPQVNFEIFDPARDLDVVLQLGGNVKKGDLYVTRQDAEGEIVRQEKGTLKAGDMERESKLTNAIARTLRMDQRVVYFTTGHGEKRLDGTETSLSSIGQLIVDTSFPVEPVRLLQGPVPNNAAAIVIAGPTIDLFDPELEMLIQYLDQGGKLILMMDPVMRRDVPMDNFTKLLGHIGMRSPNALVIDPVAVNSSNSSFTPIVQYLDHPIADASGAQPFVMMEARPFFAAESVPKGMQLEGVLVSLDKVWTESFDQLRSIRRPVPPEDPDEIGARFLAVAVEKPTPGGRFGDLMRAVAIGDSDAFADKHVGGQNIGAASFLLSSLDWMREQRTMLYIPPKLLRNTPLSMTKTTMWFLVVLFVVFGLVFTFGGTAWTLARRRAK